MSYMCAHLFTSFAVMHLCVVLLNTNDVLMWIFSLFLTVLYNSGKIQFSSF